VKKYNISNGNRCSPAVSPIFRLDSVFPLPYTLSIKKQLLIKKDRGTLGIYLSSTPAHFDNTLKEKSNDYEKQKKDR
jgi:hypothetical protein